MLENDLLERMRPPGAVITRSATKTDATRAKRRSRSDACRSEHTESCPPTPESLPPAFRFGRPLSLSHSWQTASDCGHKSGSTLTHCEEWEDLLGAAQMHERLG